MNGLLAAVLPAVLNKFRIYLTLLRFLDYSISDDVTKVRLSRGQKSWAAVTCKVTLVFAGSSLYFMVIFCLKGIHSLSLYSAASCLSAFELLLVFLVGLIISALGIKTSSFVTISPASILSLVPTSSS